MWNKNRCKETKNMYMSQPFFWFITFESSSYTNIKWGEYSRWSKFHGISKTIPAASEPKKTLKTPFLDPKEEIEDIGRFFHQSNILHSLFVLMEVSHWKPFIASYLQCNISNALKKISLVSRFKWLPWNFRLFVTFWQLFSEIWEVLCSYIARLRCKKWPCNQKRKILTRSRRIEVRKLATFT